MSAQTGISSGATLGGDPIHAVTAAASANAAPRLVDLNGNKAVFTEDGPAVRLDFASNARAEDADLDGLLVSRVGTGFAAPVNVVPVPDGSGRVFVVERAGKIWILDPATGQRGDTPFLDLTGQVERVGEGAVSGFAPAPDFATSGIFYVCFTNTDSNNELRRYQVFADDPDRANPASADTLLVVPHPNAIFHNAGWIGFGADGYLYVTTGDADALINAPGSPQDPNNFAGKILRIDVSTDAFPADPLRDYAIPADNPFAKSGGLPEVFASGLRNPFRASFDPLNGNLYIGDVGNNLREEINLLRPTDGGADFGWTTMEGTVPFAGSPSPDLTPPVIEYSHGRGLLEGRSVTGGVVYRGPIEFLDGHYIFGDFISTSLWSVDTESLSVGSTVTREQFNILTAAFHANDGSGGRIGMITSIAQDAAGNLFVTDFRDGEIYRISASDAPSFVGGSLTVAISANKVASEDQIQIDVSEGSAVSLSNGTNPGSEVRVGGTLIGLIAPGGSGIGADDLVILFNGDATAERVSALVQSLTYFNSNTADPSTATRTISYTLRDNIGVFMGGQDTVTATSFVEVKSLGGDPVANADAVATDEATPITFFVTNNDEGVEGQAPRVDKVDGTAIAVGQTVAIASGALLTLNADGSISYDPNGRFDALTAPGSGALNILAADQFSYTLTSGGTTIVNVSVAGLVSPGDQLLGGGEGEQIRGGAGADLISGEGGRDHLLGGASGDTLAGGADGDIMFGDDGEDVLRGDTGDDYLDGGSERDLIEGGAGRDHLVGGLGHDTLLGGADGDLLFGDDGEDELRGGDGGDFVVGGVGRDYVFGEGGQDTLYGGQLGDVMFGGEGEDFIFGEDGDDYVGGDGSRDVIFGAGGRDHLAGGAGHDSLLGDADGDLLFGEEGEDELRGGDGDDYGEGGAGRDFMFGDAGQDTLRGGADGDVLVGGDGNDAAFGEDGEDHLEGGLGRDTLTGGLGRDYMFGGGDADTLVGGADGDILFGEAGDDRVEGDAGDDYLDAGDGGDVLLGGDGGDVLLGGEGGDSVAGDAGADLLDGGIGRDALDGGSGNDMLLGGAAADVLIGGDGADRFVFTSLGDSGRFDLPDSPSRPGDDPFGDDGFDGSGTGGGDDAADPAVLAALLDSVAGQLDVIQDFNAAAGDLIDLSQLDANSNTAANDAFTFVGTKAFSGTAGELRHASINGRVYLFADVDGDASADMSFIVGAVSVQAQDFIL